MDSALRDPFVQSIIEQKERFVLHSDAPVSEWTIKAWCGALDDRNPAYIDEQAAIALGHGGIMAPPIMMHSYTLWTLLTPEGDSPTRALRCRMIELGYAGVVAVSYEQDYVRPIRIGDRLKRAIWVDRVSEQKVTAVGTGHFVTQMHEITNQDDELVGTMLIRVLYFDRTDTKPRGVADSEATGAPGSISLPMVEVPITATLVACGAIATLDYEKVHHDPHTARDQGMQDMFMNILTSAGLCLREATRWAGYDAKVKRIAVSLRSANYPGDVMSLSGEASCERAPGETVMVKMIGTNTIGVHVQSHITLEWPEAA